MIKETRNRGMWGALITALIIILVAIGSGFIYSQVSSVETMIRSGKVVSPNESQTGRNVVQVTAIVPEAMIEVDDGTEIYLIEYADQEGNLGYVGLQARPDDATLTNLIAAADQLATNPQWLNVSIVDTDSDEAVVNYSSLIREIMANEAELRQVFTKEYYLSQSQAHSNDMILLAVAVIGGLLGLALIGFAFYRRSQNGKAYAELYSIYPELNGSVELLNQQSDYLDTDLKVAVYKNHLITFYKGFSVQNLQEVQRIYHYQTTLRHGLYKTRQSQLIVINLVNKKRSLAIKNCGETTDAELQPLFAYLSKEHPNLEIGFNK